MNERLKYVSLKTLDSLYAGIRENLSRYRSGDFLDLVGKGGWDILLSVEADLSLLAELDPAGGPEAEISNSLIVWKSLYRLTPALACEDRVWTRLSHVECLDFSRGRWLAGQDDGKAEAAVRTHFFAGSTTACRDDHAIARLWWNAKIAKDIWPHDQRGALELMLQTADVRSNLIERRWICSRPKIASAILRAMGRELWLTEREANFREFMKVLNRRGAGIVFEVLDDSDIDVFMNECRSEAADAPQPARR